MSVRISTIGGSTSSVRIFNNRGSTPTKFIYLSIRGQYMSVIPVGIPTLKTVQSPFYLLFERKWLVPKLLLTKRETQFP